MPVSSIHEVTTLIIGKIHDALVASGIWGGTPPDVYPDPVSRDDQRFGISFYLYHALESPHFKNVVPAGKDTPPVKLVNMGLNLYYQLTAISREQGIGEAAYNEQQMMSIALKTLHDMPLLTSGEDRYRITLQTIPADGAVRNWTAGSSFLRFSAYYEVSPVFLEAEKPGLYSGRVLAYGSYVFPSGAPRITLTGSTIGFTIPGELTPREVIAQPAQVPPGGVMQVEGSGFNDGAIQLRLFNAKFQENVIAPGWAIVVSAGKLTITVGATAILEQSGTPVDILPGMYSLQLIVTKSLLLPGGTTQNFNQTSNQFPFIVMPVASITSIAAVVTVDGFGYQVLGPVDPTPDEMEVYIGIHRLTRSWGVLSSGQFTVVSTTELNLNLPAGLVSGQDLPLRVIVSGAESNPVWIHIP